VAGLLVNYRLLNTLRKITASEDFREVFRHWWDPNAFSSRRFSSRTDLQRLLMLEEPGKSWRLKEHLPILESELSGRWLFRAEKRNLNFKYSIGSTKLQSDGVTSWTTELDIAQYFLDKSTSVLFIAQVPVQSVLYVPWLDPEQTRDVLNTREKEVLVLPGSFEGFAFEYSRSTKQYDVGDDEPYDERDFIELAKSNGWVT
jgi:hypothetical protein